MDSLLDHPMLPYIRQADYAIRTPWLAPQRRLLDYLLIYIQEGQCVVTVEGLEYEFNAGEFCFIQPNVLHTLQGKTNTITPFAHMDIFFNPLRKESFTTWGHTDLSPYQRLLQPKLNEMDGIDVPVRLIISDPVEFRETMLKMIGLWKNRDAISQLQAQVLALQLVLSIVKDYTKIKSQSIQPPDTLNWIASYLSFNLSQKITVNDMADKAMLSPSRFTALFQKIFGVSPHQYLIHLRVQQAQSLLKSSTYNLSDISDFCGFSNIHHFSRSFKKVTGEAPSQFRKRNGQV